MAVATCVNCKAVSTGSSLALPQTLSGFPGRGNCQTHLRTDLSATVFLFLFLLFHKKKLIEKVAEVEASHRKHGFRKQVTAKEGPLELRRKIDKHLAR